MPAKALHELSDEDLMLAYADGDVRAFELLYDRNRKALYGFIYRSLQSSGDADALFQDVWARVIAARERYAPSAKFSTWLFQIARNRLVDHWRQHRTADELDPEQRVSGDAEPDAVHEQNDRRDALDAAIGRLPPEQREVLLLRLQRGFTLPQIAEITGSDPEAAKSRLRYAIARLRNELKPGGSE